MDSINRFLTEELVRCTIESLSSNRKQWLVKCLCASLLLPESWQITLCLSVCLSVAVCVCVGQCNSADPSCWEAAAFSYALHYHWGMYMSFLVINEARNSIRLLKLICLLSCLGRFCSAIYFNCPSHLTRWCIMELSSLSCANWIRLASPSWYPFLHLVTHKHRQTYTGTFFSLSLAHLLKWVLISWL